LLKEAVAGSYMSSSAINVDALRTTADMAHEASVAADTASLQAVTQRFDEMVASYPDFPAYLLLVFFPQHPLVPDEVRASLLSQPQVSHHAGAMLNGLVSRRFNSFSQSARDAIREALPSALQASPSQRALASTISASVLRQASIEHWPTLLPALMAMLASPDQGAVRSALELALKMSEDDPRSLCRAAQATEQLIPALVQFSASHPCLEFRGIALNALRPYFVEFPPALAAHFPAVLAAIADALCASDDVLQGTDGLLLAAAEAINEVVMSKVQYLAADPAFSLRVAEREVALLERAGTHQDPATADERVGTALASFWSYCCDEPEALETSVIIPALPRLLPALLSALHYSPDAAEVLEAGAHVDASGTRGGGQAQNRADAEEDDIDAGWTLRKACAEALDSLVRELDHSVLPSLLPLLPPLLNHASWISRDAGILALGAAARSHSGLRALTPHLPDVTASLLAMCRQTGSGGQAQVLVQALWCLGRFAPWILQTDASLHLLSPTIDAGMTHCTAQDARVVRSALSLLAILAEVAHESGLDHLLAARASDFVALFSHLSQVLIGQRNLVNLLDVAGQVSRCLDHASFLDAFGPLLFPFCAGLLSSLPEGDYGIMNALEAVFIAVSAHPSCVSAPALAAPLSAVANFAIATVTQLTSAISQSPIDRASWPDPDFTAISLDVLASLAAAGKASMTALFEAAGLPDLLRTLSSVTDNAIVQYVFSLLGDLCQVSAQLVERCLAGIGGNIVPVLRNPQFYPQGCNNALWALGEATMILPQSPVLAEILPVALQDATTILLADETADELRVNATILFCRVALTAIQQPARYFEDVVDVLLETMADLSPGASKLDVIQCFQGLCLLVQAQPQVISAMPQVYVPLLAAALCSWPPSELPASLQEPFRQILAGYVQVCGTDWPRIKASCDEVVQQVLSTVYQL
jgi:hypothetical protein